MISLCMIVKNEEDNLDRCLKSAKDITDEIIIVDTGSTDSTVKIAKKYTSNVYFYEWNNDFSAARNFSISKANGDWILLLDADDEIPDQYRDYIKELTKDCSIDLYFFNTLNLINKNDTKNVVLNLNPRLFQNKPGYRFKDKIHEQIATVISEKNPNAVLKNVPIDIYHYGYIHDNVVKQNKRERNMKILTQLLKQDCGNPILLANMGNEYFAMDNIEEAFNYYLEAYKTLKPNCSLYPRLILRLLLCCKKLKLYDNFYMYANIALKYYPSFTDIYYIRGYLNYFCGKPTAAIRDLEKALELGIPNPVLAYFKGTGTYKSTQLLCKIYFDFEDYEKCAYYCTKLLKYAETATIENLKIYIHCLYKLNTPKEHVENAMKIILNSNKQKGYIYASNTLIVEKDYVLALKYIDKGIKDLYGKNIDATLKNSLINNLNYFKGICQFFNKDYEESIKTLININQKEYIEQSTPYLFLSGMFTQNKNAINFSISNTFYSSQVCNVLYDILNNKKYETLTEDETKSALYENSIFTILEILLYLKENNKFKKSLSLFDLINSKYSLLKLGKLYYNYGKYDLCKNALMRSISIYNIIDEKGSRILSKLCMEEPEYH